MQNIVFEATTAVGHMTITATDAGVVNMRWRIKHRQYAHTEEEIEEYLRDVVGDIQAAFCNSPMMGGTYIQMHDAFLQHEQRLIIRGCVGSDGGHHTGSATRPGYVSYVCTNIGLIWSS